MITHINSTSQLKDKILELLALHPKGLAISEIQARVGASHKTVHRFFKTTKLNHLRDIEDTLIVPGENHRGTTVYKLQRLLGSDIRTLHPLEEVEVNPPATNGAKPLSPVVSPPVVKLTHQQETVEWADELIEGALHNDPKAGFKKRILTTLLRHPFGVTLDELSNAVKAPKDAVQAMLTRECCNAMRVLDNTDIQAVKCGDVMRYVPRQIYGEMVRPTFHTLAEPTLKPAPAPVAKPEPVAQSSATIPVSQAPQQVPASQKPRVYWTEEEDEMVAQAVLVFRDQYQYIGEIWPRLLEAAAKSVLPPDRWKAVYSWPNLSRRQQEKIRSAIIGQREQLNGTAVKEVVKEVMVQPDPAAVLASLETQDLLDELNRRLDRR